MFSHVDFLGFQIGLITGLLLLSGGVILSKAGLIGGSNRNDLADSIQHLRTDNNVQRLETKAEKEEEDADLGIRALHDDDDDSDSTISSQSDRLELAEDHLEDEAGMASKEQVEESNDEIWKRVHIEEALSAELIRQCPNCLVAIVRETGCNMMVCSFCYAKMCYVCKKPIQGYSHFRLQNCQLQANSATKTKSFIPDLNLSKILRSALSTPPTMNSIRKMW